MNTAYLLLGSNLGKRESFLSQAIDLINEIGTRVIAKSSIYNTAPWGKKPKWLAEQNDFLNQAVCVETFLSAEKLLEEILSIEKSMGRIRSHKSQVTSQKTVRRTPYGEARSGSREQ